MTWIWVLGICMEISFPPVRTDISISFMARKVLTKALTKTFKNRLWLMFIILRDWDKSKLLQSKYSLVVGIMLSYPFANVIFIWRLLIFPRGENQPSNKRKYLQISIQGEGEGTWDCIMHREILNIVSQFTTIHCLIP